LIRELAVKLLVIPLMLAFFIIPVSGDTTVRPTVQVSCQTDPLSLFPGDNGTVTVSLKNMATGDVYVQEDSKTFDMNAYVVSASLIGTNEIEVLDKGYSNIGLVGPQDTLNLTFSIRAKKEASSGMHFLKFELIGGSDMYDLNYKVPIKIDDRNVQLVFSNLPSNMMNEISTIKVDIINPRSSDVNNVMLNSSCEGFLVSPSNLFVGTIPAGNNSSVEFTVNAVKSNSGNKNIKCFASYFNGDNLHTSEITSANINVTSKQALILTNIELKNLGTKYTITGEINNVGSTDIRNVVISLIDSKGINSTQPYPSYFIGSLEKDDFSSFELSAFVSPGTLKIPLLIEFRGTDNSYTSITKSVSLDSEELPAQTNKEASSPLFLVVGIILCIAVFGIIGYSWKKQKKNNQRGGDT
jgi:hypothetical protein